MRCLLIQSDGMHKGQDGWTPNDYLRECHAFQYAFQANGWIADVWGKRHANFETPPNLKDYDLVFIMEQYEMEWLPDLSVSGPLKIQWIVDLHCQNKDVYGAITKHVDVVAHATSSLIPEYQSLHPRQQHIWFPNGVDERYFYNYPNIPKEKNLVFVGSRNPNREETIKLLEQHGLDVYFATGVDMIKLIRQTKIHFNKNIDCDLNYRHFETIGLGTCLLTQYQPDLERLGFKDRENCLWYKDDKECIEKAEKSIDDRSWDRIGNSGFELSKRHSYSNRIKRLLEQI